MAITYFVVNEIYLCQILKFLGNAFYPEDVFRDTLNSSQEYRWGKEIIGQSFRMAIKKIINFLEVPDY